MKKWLLFLNSIAAILLSLLSYQQPARQLHYLWIVVLSMVIIGIGLVALCYILKLKEETGYKIIDCGYWTGFAVVVLCVFCSAQQTSAAIVHQTSPVPPLQLPAQSSKPCQPYWVKNC